MLDGSSAAKVLIVVSKPAWKVETEPTVLAYEHRSLIVNAFIKAGIHEDDLAFCLDTSPELIKAHRANVLVPLGNGPLLMLTGLESIDKWHCSVLTTIAEYGRRKVIPMFDCERVEKEFRNTAYLTLGAMKCKAEQDFPESRTPQRTCHIHASYEETLNFLHTAQFAPEIALDLETSLGLINTLGIAISPTEAIAIRLTNDHWTEDQLYNLWSAINTLLSSGIPVIAQNLIYESTYLAAYGIWVKNFVWDTMWAMKFLHPEFEMGLDNVGRVYTPFPYWKDDNKDWSIVRDWDAHLTYNCYDTIGTYWAKTTQLKALTEANLLKPFQELCLGNIDIIRKMCSRGIAIDMRAHAEIKEATERKFLHHQDGVSKYFQENLKREVNTRSPKQMKTAFKELGFKIPLSKGKESVDKKALVKLRKKHPDNLLFADLLALSKENKKLANYINFTHTPDNQLRYLLNGHGTETGRWCLKKGTQISCLGEEKNIEDVKVGDLVYCYDNQRNLQLSTITWSGQTGHKALIRLHWKAQSGRKGYLDLTPEHQVRRITGEYVRADQLKTGDRTLALRRYLDAGYIKLIGRNQKIREHVFAFEHAHGYRPEVVHHLNANKLDNKIENLEGTTTVNHVRAHALEEGRKPPQPNWQQRVRGERTGTAKLSEQEVLKIKELIASKHTTAGIAKIFNVSTGCIKNIRSGKSWSHIQLNNHIIERIETLSETADVYDLEVKDWHNFIANEICVHNSGYCDPWGHGFNPQTVPSFAKKMFRAKPGHVLMNIDLSQAESRYVAYDGPEPALIDLLESGEDVHRYVASKIFNKPAELISKTSKERQLGKKAGHASNYGTGPRTFSEMCLVEMDIVISEFEAKRIIEGYYEIFPGIVARQRRIENELRKTKTLTTPLGRRRIFYDRFNSGTFREAYAYCPQSTIPDITNALMRFLHSNFEDASILLQVHDSLLLEVENGRQFEIAAAAGDYGAWHPTIDLRGGRLLIPVDIEVGTHWKPMEKI